MYDYYDLIQRVQQTNNLLDTQNTMISQQNTILQSYSNKLDGIHSSVTLSCLLFSTMVVLKIADVIHHMIDSVYKRK